MTKWSALHQYLSAKVIKNHNNNLWVNKKRRTIQIAISEDHYEELQKALELLKGTQLPFSTTVEQFVELILSNYVATSNKISSLAKSGFDVASLQQELEKIGNLSGVDDNLKGFLSELLKTSRNGFSNPNKDGKKKWWR